LGDFTVRQDLHVKTSSIGESHNVGDLTIVKDLHVKTCGFWAFRQVALGIYMGDFTVREDLHVKTGLLDK